MPKGWWSVRVGTGSGIEKAPKQGTAVLRKGIRQGGSGWLQSANLHVQVQRI